MTKICIIYTIFNLFYIEYLKLLKRLSEVCNKLIVVVLMDEFNIAKAKKKIIILEQKAEIVKSIKYVSIVIAENNWEQKIENIHKYDVDIFAIANDWNKNLDCLKVFEIIEKLKKDLE